MSVRVLFLALLGSATVAGPVWAAQPTVKATDVWCRAAPRGAPAGGCYLTLTASGDDRLVAVETAAADHGEIHTMSIEGGIMKMRRLPDGLALPAGRLVSLKPGGEHLMIIGPKASMLAGGVLPITLKFAKAPPLTLRAPIRQAPVSASSTTGSAHR